MLGQDAGFVVIGRVDLRPTGQTSGQVQMAGQAWLWRRTVSGTAVPGMGRIDIAVYADDGLAAERTLFRSAGS